VKDASQSQQQQQQEALIQVWQGLFLKLFVVNSLSPSQTQGMTTMLTFVQDAIDKYFDKFELYCLSNVFHIPENVTVPGDPVRGRQWSTLNSKPLSPSSTAHPSSH